MAKYTVDIKADGKSINQIEIVLYEALSQQAPASKTIVQCDCGSRVERIIAGTVRSHILINPQCTYNSSS